MFVCLFSQQLAHVHDLILIQGKLVRNRMELRSLPRFIRIFYEHFALYRSEYRFVLLADTWQPDHSTDTAILFGGSQEFIDGCVGYANVFRNALALALLCLPAAQHYFCKTCFAEKNKCCRNQKIIG